LFYLCWSLVFPKNIANLAINIRYSGIFFASEASLYVCYVWLGLGPCLAWSFAPWAWWSFAPKVGHKEGPILGKGKC
jgi:hypothetical protein